MASEVTPIDRVWYAVVEAMQEGVRAQDIRLCVAEAICEYTPADEDDA